MSTSVAVDVRSSDLEAHDRCLKEMEERGKVHFVTASNEELTPPVVFRWKVLACLFHRPLVRVAFSRAVTQLLSNEDKSPAKRFVLGQVPGA